MKLPDKPELIKIYNMGDRYVTETTFDAWYDKTFAGAVEVYSPYSPDKLIREHGWTPWEGMTDKSSALLIQIEPIAKPDTSESLLRELILASETKVLKLKLNQEGGYADNVIERAKAYLNKKGELKYVK